MWNLKDLRGNVVTAKINDRWVPARPLSYTRAHCPLIERIKDAWAVFWCEAEAFKWPEGQ